MPIKDDNGPVERIALILDGAVSNVIRCTEKMAEVLLERGECDDIHVLDKDERAAIGWRVAGGIIEEPPPPAPPSVEAVALDAAASFKSVFTTGATIEELAAALVTAHLKKLG